MELYADLEQWPLQYLESVPLDDYVVASSLRNGDYITVSFPKLAKAMLDYLRRVGGAVHSSWKKLFMFHHLQLI